MSARKVRAMYATSKISIATITAAASVKIKLPGAAMKLLTESKTSCMGKASIIKNLINIKGATD